MTAQEILAQLQSVAPELAWEVVGEHTVAAREREKGKELKGGPWSLSVRWSEDGCRADLSWGGSTLCGNNRPTADGAFDDLATRFIKKRWTQPRVSFIRMMQPILGGGS